MFTAYGRRIALRTNSPEVLRMAVKHFPFGWRPSSCRIAEKNYSIRVHAGRGYHRLFGGAEELACSRNLEDVFEAFERDARRFVAEYARRRIFVHAAAVGWKGRAIVIPGGSLSGKTTLAAEFVRAGAIYYSDEYVVLDDRGRVHPYAKPLSIRIPEDRSYCQTDHPVEAFGGRAGTRPLPIGLVLVTEYRKGARWRPRSVSAGMGAMSLLANTVSARKQPEKTLDVLRNAICDASVLKSARGEACGVVESVICYGLPNNCV